MDKGTHVTVIVTQKAVGSVAARATVVSAAHSKDRFLVRVEPRQPAGNTVHPLRYDEEGITWTAGWDGKHVSALRAAHALASKPPVKG